jgi:hypothetical protein
LGIGRYTDLYRFSIGEIRGGVGTSCAKQQAASDK